MELNEHQKSVITSLGFDLDSITDESTAAEARTNLMMRLTQKLKTEHEQEVENIHDEYKVKMNSRTTITADQRKELERYNLDKSIEQHAARANATLQELTLVRQLINQDYNILEGGGIVKKRGLGTLNFMGNDCYSVGSLIDSIRKKTTGATSTKKNETEDKYEGVDALTKFFNEKGRR